MQSNQIEYMRDPDRERHSWHGQYVQNALGMIGQIKTKDKQLADHLLVAEQALRKASAYLNSKV